MGSTVSAALSEMIPTSDYSLAWRVVVNPAVDQAHLNSMTVEYLNFDDTSIFGVFDIGTPGGWDLAKARAYCQARGSDLYAAAMWKKEVFSVLGITRTNYHVVLVHSFIPFLAAAMILVGVWLIAEWINGQSPAVSLQQLANGLHGFFHELTPAGAVSAAKSAFIWIAVAGAGITLGYWAVTNRITEKHTGAFTPPPPAPAFQLPSFGVQPTSNVSLPIPGGGHVDSGVSSSVSAFGKRRGGPVRRAPARRPRYDARSYRRAA